MIKTFKEILAERDDEYTYYVRSTADIHNPEKFERVRLEFIPYQVKSVEAETYTPLAKDNKWFPNESNSPTFSIKVVTGLPVPKAALIMTLAMNVHIHTAHLRIDGEDDIETDLVNEPETIDKEFSQSLVGQHRIGEFVRELQADRKDREKKTITREVYESYFTTHRSIEGLLRKPVRNGYYMVERYQEEGKDYLFAEGPFAARPDGNVYRDHVKVLNAQLVSESQDGGMYGVRLLIDAVTDNSEMADRIFEVGVQDLNSGRRFTAIVRSPTSARARIEAVRQVAEQHRLSPDQLTALAPKPSKSEVGGAWEEGGGWKLGEADNSQRAMGTKHHEQRASYHQELARQGDGDHEEAARAHMTAARSLSSGHPEAQKHSAYATNLSTRLGVVAGQSTFTPGSGWHSH